LRPQSLRHAAGDAEDRVLLHEPAQLAQTPDHALLRVLSDGARVHEDDVGAFGPVHTLISLGRELSEHQLGIAHVHLATVGFYVYGRHSVGRRTGDDRRQKKQKTNNQEPITVNSLATIPHSRRTGRPISLPARSTFLRQRVRAVPRTSIAAPSTHLGARPQDSPR